MSISAAAPAVLVLTRAADNTAKLGKLLLRRNMSMGIVIRSWLVCVRNVKFMIVVAAGAPCSAVPAADCRTFLLKITLSSCKTSHC